MITIAALKSLKDRYNRGTPPTPKTLQYLALKAIRDLYGSAYEIEKTKRAIMRSVSYLVASGYTLESSEAIVADWLWAISEGWEYATHIKELRGGAK